MLRRKVRYCQNENIWNIPKMYFKFLFGNGDLIDLLFGEKNPNICWYDHFSDIKYVMQSKIFSNLIPPFQIGT